MITGVSTVNGTELAFDTGGEKPVVLFAHGFALDHRMWEPQIGALRGEWRVLPPDLRGLVRSEPGLPGP